MSRILIAEPHVEVRELLERVVRRLGSEPVSLSAMPDVAAVDAALVETAAPGGVDIAQALHDAGVPTIVVSIQPPTPELRELEPAAYLLKPFSLAELETAIASAIAGDTRSGG
jgi:CheY-like chemotaxis protein